MTTTTQHFPLPKEEDRALSRQALPVHPGSHARLGTEHLVEVGMGREAALRGDGLVAVMGILDEHTACLLETDFAEPHAETASHTLFKVGRELLTVDAQAA